MEIIETILIIIGVALLFAGIGIGVWYYLRLKKDQLILVTKPGNWAPTTTEASQVATSLNGHWATLPQFTTGMGQGFYINTAGYLQDITTPNVACQAHTCQAGNTGCPIPPVAYYTQYMSGTSGSAMGVTFGTACGQGYYIFGDRTAKVLDGFTVIPWNAKRANQYQILTLGELWDQLKGGDPPVDPPSS